MKDFAKGSNSAGKKPTRKRSMNTGRNSSTSKAAYKPKAQKAKRKPSKKSNSTKLFSSQKIFAYVIVILAILLLGIFLMSGSKHTKNVKTTSKNHTNTTASSSQKSKDQTPPPATKTVLEDKTTPTTNKLETVNKTKPETTSKEKQGNAEQDTTEKPKFTFYSNLTNETVKVDTQPDEIKKYKTTYMLQVGSYRDKQAVDAMRARLILIGLKPEVSKHGDWYRIDVGPVYSKRDGDVLKHKLQENQISGSMLRQVAREEVKSDS